MDGFVAPPESKTGALGEASKAILERLQRDTKYLDHLGAIPPALVAALE